MEFQHKSIMLNECLEGLSIKEDGIYVDGTLGGGGHSFHILERLGERGRLIGIDQDEDAIKAATKRLEAFANKVTIVRDNYEHFQTILSTLSIPKVDGILLDLGVSSYQFDEADRGFSYRFDAPLDMRMDRRQDFTAKDLINNYSEQELYHIIRDYGEDKFARNIAKHIVKEREKKPIETTFELSEIISHAIPMKMRVQGGHPAKKTFQAVRIALNRELEVLEESIEGMIKALKPEGRLCIISFHSLEDRIVKKAFRTAEDPCICPKDFPICTCGRKSLGRVISKKAIIPSDLEMEENPRARSAKLRIFERGQ
jgi:S-adenosyl-methyltransferase mraW